MYRDEYLLKQMRSEIRKEFNSLNAEKELLGHTRAWVNNAPNFIKDKNTGKTLEPKTVYVGDKPNLQGGLVPTYEHPVLRLDLLDKALNVINNAAASSTEIDKAIHNPYYPAFHKYIDAVSDPAALVEAHADGAMTSQDFPTINVTTFAGALVAQQDKLYPMVDAFATEFTTDMVFRELYGDEFNIDSELGEGEKPRPKKPAFYKTTFAQHKSGGALEWTYEMTQQPYLIDPIAYSKNVINKDMRRIYNDKLLALLSSASIGDVAGSSYKGYTNGRSTNNPLEAIMANQLTILTSGKGNSNMLIMSPDTFAYFQANDNIKGIFNTQGLQGMSGVFTSTALPNYRILVDPNWVSGKVLILDDSIVKRKQGSILVGQFEEQDRLVTKYVYFNFNTAYIQDVAKAKRITGVLA